MELLYEASNFHIQLHWVLPFAILGFAGLYALYKGNPFIKCLGIVALVICAYTLIHFCYGYVTIIEAYKNGNYQTVEGKIENFQPASQGGETTEDEEQESFNIRTVHFAYDKESFIHKFGYHKTSANGGYINENGQEFQIGYIPTKAGNVIVKIEEITEE
jgi:hypothetical protein